MSISTAKTVNRYRYFCTTESNYVYKWDEVPPTTCVNNETHTIDIDSITIIDKVQSNGVEVVNLLKSPYDELRIAEKTPIIELKSMFGKSELRDIYSSNSTTAGISNVVGIGEYELYVTNANDRAQMQSAERGRYIAGQTSEAGLGVRIPNGSSNNQEIRWGLFDSNNGFFFMQNSNGLNVGIINQGVETIIPRSEFNVDRLDGNGPSGTTFNVADGHIYNIVYSWYGYGIVQWIVNTEDRYGDQKPLLLHKYFSSGGTSVKNPNLPLNVIIDNKGTNIPAKVYVSGRQFSIIGKYTPVFRVNAAYRTGFTVTNVFRPVLSIKRKPGTEGNAVKLLTADFYGGAEQILQIRVKTTLTGASFVPIPDQQPDESIMLYDISANTVSDGIVIWTGIAPADKTALQQVENIQYNLSEQDILTLCTRSVSGVNQTISTIVRWQEEW